MASRFPRAGFASPGRDGFGSRGRNGFGSRGRNGFGSQSTLLFFWKRVTERHGSILRSGCGTNFCRALASLSDAIGFGFWRGNNTLDRAPDTSTQRALVRAFVPGPPFNVGAQPVTKRTRTAGQVLRPAPHRLFGFIDSGIAEVLCVSRERRRTNGSDAVRGSSHPESNARWFGSNQESPNSCSMGFDSARIAGPREHPNHDAR